MAGRAVAVAAYLAAVEPDAFARLPAEHVVGAVAAVVVVGVVRRADAALVEAPTGRLACGAALFEAGEPARIGGDAAAGLVEKINHEFIAETIANA